MERFLTISVYCCKLIFKFGRRLFIGTKRFVFTLVFSPFTYIMSCWKRGSSESEDQAVCMSCIKYQDEIEVLQSMLEKLKRDKDSLLKQNADIKQRSEELTSSMADVLETKGALENVNDEHSNTKLTKKFENLYDNRWTELSEWFYETRSDLTELDRVKELSALMKKAYEECLKLSENQLRGFLFLEKDETVSESKEVDALLKIRRVNGQMKSTRHSVIKKVLSRVINEDSKCELIVGDTADEAKHKLEEFFHEYIDICWLMAISHPRLLLVFDIVGKPYSGVIKDRFKQYSTQETVESTDFVKGSVYEVVWPCVLLEDESGLYSKGDVITVDVCKQSK